MRNIYHPFYEYLFLFGRFLFAAYFVVSGYRHLTRTKALAAGYASRGIPAATVVVVLGGVLMLVGGLAVMVGFHPKLGSALIIVQLLGTMPLVHRFWGLPDPERAAAERALFLRDVALLGAAIMFLARVGWPWPLSLG